MSNGSDYFNLSKEYASESTPSAASTMSIEPKEITSRDIQVENQKYGAAKPRRIVVRAGIIHDQS